MLFVVRFDVEIYASVAFVSHAVAENLTNELLLLDYVPRSVRLYARVLDIQCVHGCMEAVGVILCHLHRFELFEACFLLYLVLPLVGVVLQVANVGYVPYVAHLVAQVLEVAEKHVERNGRARVAQVRVAVHRRTAYIHSHSAGGYRHEFLFLARARIVYYKILFHINTLFGLQN